MRNDFSKIGHFRSKTRKFCSEIVNFIFSHYPFRLKMTNFIWKIIKKGLIKAKNDLKGLPTELEFEILSAVDINNNVLGCYRLNNRKIEDRVKNADCTAYEWEKVDGYNTLVCSPPCQESLKLRSRPTSSITRSVSMISASHVRPVDADCVDRV